MAIMRRILKYTPAVVMGLLVVAWVASWFLICGAGIVTGHFTVSAVNSTVQVVCTEFYRPELTGVLVQRKPIQWSARAIAGHLECRELPGFISVYLPYPLLLTALLPLAISPSTFYRFRLWHYLAYTALVAVELAYYLRWQA